MRPERKKERIVSVYGERINVDAGWAYPNLNVYPENGDKVILNGWSRNRRIYTVEGLDNIYNRLILRYGNTTITHPLRDVLCLIPIRGEDADMKPPPGSLVSVKEFDTDSFGTLAKVRHTLGLTGEIHLRPIYSLKKFNADTSACYLIKR